MQRFAPAEIELEFADGEYLFRLPAKQIAELQERRGYKVTWPDGASGHRPKALGTIWREHLAGEADPQDSREVIRLALIGGGKASVNGTPREIDRTAAKLLVEDDVETWPEMEIVKFATTILIACCNGFRPPEDKDDPPKKPKRRAKTSSSTSPPPPPT